MESIWMKMDELDENMKISWKWPWFMCFIILDDRLLANDENSKKKLKEFATSDRSKLLPNWYNWNKIQITPRNLDAMEQEFNLIRFHQLNKEKINDTAFRMLIFFLCFALGFATLRKTHCETFLRSDHNKKLFSFLCDNKFQEFKRKCEIISVYKMHRRYCIISFQNKTK